MHVACSPGDESVTSNLTQQDVPTDHHQPDWSRSPVSLGRAMSDKKSDSVEYTMLAKLLIVFLIVHLLAVITLILCFSSDHEVASVVVPVSSVWCHGTTLENRRCYFKNLCYSFEHGEFVFVRGKESVVEGLPTTAKSVRPRKATTPTSARGPENAGIFGGDHSNPNPRYSPIHSGIADLSGGVENHGNVDFHFSYTEIPDTAIKAKNFTSSILPERMLVFRRFKPDNLMHVIHDDLLPLYASLGQLEHAGARDYRIFFADPHGEGPFWELYRVFRSRSYLNSHHPLVPTSLRAEVDKDADLVCFATAAVGGMINTKWYQYGFNRYQGPSSTSQITGVEIRAFANFARHGLEVPKYDIDMPRYGSRVRQKHPYAVLFSRQSNRRILNEVELSIAISGEFDLRTVTVNLETHSLSEIVHLLDNATMLVGMHGAQLALSMFLPVNSIVLEIFPYGIPANDYTPYKTLAAIDGMGLIYRAWENKDVTKTTPHPEYDEKFGGIARLPVDRQAEIQANVPVKQHICCRDQAFLYRMYQDTEVDVNNLIETARTAITERNTTLTLQAERKSFDLELSPAEIKTFNCSYLPQRNVFHVDWEGPWNRAYLTGQLRYVVRVHPVGAAVDSSEFETNDGHLDVPAGKDSSVQLNLWIAPVAGDEFGPWTRRPVRCHR